MFYFICMVNLSRGRRRARRPAGGRLRAAASPGKRTDEGARVSLVATTRSYAHSRVKNTNDYDL